jgi:hypothetical protein
MTLNVELSLILANDITRDHVMDVYGPAYEEHATDAQRLLQRYGNGPYYRRERWYATLLLRAITNELEDVKPAGLNVSWAEARDIIERV